MTPDVLPVYIGWDSRETDAFEVCKHSLVRHSSIPLFVVELRAEMLRYTGLYHRGERIDGGQKYDEIDGKPFSTEFSFSRFLTPILAQYYDGWAVFMDCDMLFRGDIAELLALADPKYAVMVVKHDHVPPERVKMDAQEQTRYRRKNWSSFVLWNCGHPSNRNLTVDAVNREPGSWLHQFGWLRDDEIGELPLAWNYLVGYNTKAECPDPINVHYTTGGPWFPDYKGVEYADEWLAEQRLARYRINPSQAEAFLGGKDTRAPAYEYLKTHSRQRVVSP